MKALRDMAQECEWPRFWSIVTAGSLVLTIALFILAHNS